MFNHVMLGSNDIARSQRFYDAVLGVLGVAPATASQSPSGHHRIAYRHDGQMLMFTQPINSLPATWANGGTLGFKCSSPEQVMRFHEVALEHGGTTAESPPGLREGGPGKRWLAYVRDPDGHKLCAIYRPA